MITGINKVFEHAGSAFHIQAEDLGAEAAAFEVRVYDAGSVLWQKRISYQDLLDQNLDKKEREQQLHGRMEKLVLTVEAAIERGKIP
ncbi:MAG: hypothetical protein AAGD38_08205 [Acidobacteriota bacterium]